MPAELYANGAASTLGSSINSSQTTLTVASATGFPTGVGQFRIIIDSEIMIVTNVSGTTFTVTRGAEGTAGASHTSGAAVTHDVTRDSIKRSAESNFWLGTRPVGRGYTVKVENETYTAGETKTVCNLTGIGPGYIASMWMAVNGSTAAARENSVFTLFREGSATADINMTMASLHGAYYGPAAYNNPWMGWVPTGSFQNRFIIPFTDGFKINLTNGDGSNSAQMYMVVQYVKTLQQWDWGRMGRFKATRDDLSNITKYSSTTLLDVAGRGVFFGIYQVFHDGNDHDFHFAEGNHEFYVDGEMTPSLEWSGTEDYFENAGYWNGGVLIGPHTGTNVKSGTTDVGCYRFHVPDPIIFDTHLTVKWNCGNALQGGGMTSNLANMIYTMYYYLDQ